jgi:methionyl aminopeptidase
LAKSFTEHTNLESGFDMYDGGPNLGRNDECWCGSGKKYKKCHADFDERLEALARHGEEVPARWLLKTPEEIEGIKRSAEVNVGVLDYVAQNIAEGISTEQIDRWVYDYTVDHGAIPAPLDYEGFPKSVCTSIDEVVCHGIPDEGEILKSGQIINVDCSTIKDGYFSDSSRMFCIGDVSAEKAELVRATKEAVELGLAAVKPWGHLGDIGAVIHKFAKEHGYSVVREFGGHGIGLEFHEEPFVSFVTKAHTGPILVPGLMFTIEPMINLGKHHIDMSDPNGWTVRTKDRKPTAQWEVQIVITEDGYELISW